MSDIGKRIRNFLQLDTQEIAQRWRESRLRKKEASRRETGDFPREEASTAARSATSRNLERTEAAIPVSKEPTSQIVGTGSSAAKRGEPLAGGESEFSLKGKELAAREGAKVPSLGEFPFPTKAKARSLRALLADYTDALKKRLTEAIVAAARRLAALFPFEIAPTERFEELPAASRLITGFLAASALGLVLSVGLMLIFRRRAPYFPLFSAVVVAIAVIIVFKGKTGFPVGVFAAGLAFFSLVLGEMVAQLLHRAEIIRLMDMLGLPTGAKEEMVYRRYYFNLLVIRVLPSVILSFLIGFWPFKKRIRYKGFQKP